MNGIDLLLMGFGLAGIVLSVAAMIGKRSTADLLPVGGGSLGVFIVGLGGYLSLMWLMIVGAALLGVGIFFEFRPKPNNQSQAEEQTVQKE
jgi:hypothetical protein